MLFYIRVFAVCAVDNSCQNAFLRINKIELRVLYVEFSAQGLDNRIYKVCIFICIQICWCTGKCSFNKMLQIFGEDIYGIILGNQFLAYIETFCVHPVQFQFEEVVDYLFVNASMNIRVLHNYLKKYLLRDDVSNSNFKGTTFY